jgi:hypothetical protein
MHPQMVWETVERKKDPQMNHPRLPQMGNEKMAAKGVGGKGRPA